MNDKAQEVPQVEVGTREEQIVISEIDMLKSQNAHLHLMVASYQVNSLRTQLVKAQEELQRRQTVLIEMQRRVSEKYNIDLSNSEIGEDGVVTPRQAPAGVTDLLQRISTQV